jgi:hypothetical protein
MLVAKSLTIVDTSNCIDDNPGGAATFKLSWIERVWSGIRAGSFENEHRRE